ncbi:MAG: preprotein translocase subunit SecY [Planctomycetes bacterium]|nr:preprotein translocase subunit SecY [Planctomycetota bacterium]
MQLLRIPEVRAKIGLTLLLLGVYRLGFSVVLPNVDQSALAETMKNQGAGEGLDRMVAMLSLFSASNIGMMTIFGLGIMPYISASIIFQLLGTVYPPLEALQKEGEAGRRKINEYTRYATVVICIFQSFFYVRAMGSTSFLADFGKVGTDYSLIWQISAAITMTTGSVFLMWVGEQIDEFGIGNGVSLLIMAGILARMPEAVRSLVWPVLQNGMALGSPTGIERYVTLIILFLVVVVCVVMITQAQRKIPVHSAKHVRGARVVGGQIQSLPIKINQSGVMPIIFASSLLMFPTLIFGVLAKVTLSVPVLGTIFTAADVAFRTPGGVFYNTCYVGLIYFFCFFWTAVTFNPTEMANNLKDFGSFVPGYRPGARTAQYLERVMLRMTFVGAAFLSLVAIIPTVVVNSMSVDYLVASFFGGTGLLICVSVVIDLVTKLDSQLVMRGLPTLLDRETK